LKYKHLLVPNLFIALKGKIDPPRNGIGQVDITLHSIELLQNMREKRVKSIYLNIPAKSLEQRLISDLNKLFIENEGTYPVNFRIFDPADNTEVALSSRSVKIDLNNQFIHSLKEMEVEYSLG
jgi:DNA polymerase-3 subunit alpha